jgi:hypothetical protein
LRFDPANSLSSPCIAVLLLLGCESSGDTLGRLVEHWSDETVLIASPALTDALVVAGMAAEFCAAGESLDWSSLEVGDEPPLSERIDQALGDPQVEQVDDFGAGSVQVTLSGVVIGDRDEAILRFVTASDSDGLALEAAILDARQVEEDQPEGEPFGRLLFQVESDCSGTLSRVSGAARWTDLESRTHNIRLPADEGLGLGVGFSEPLPWLPVTGTVAWSGRVEGQERSVTTFDAADLSVEGDEDAELLPLASWPSVVSGPDWVYQQALSISPGE